MPGVTSTVASTVPFCWRNIRWDLRRGLRSLSLEEYTVASTVAFGRVYGHLEERLRSFLGVVMGSSSNAVVVYEDDPEVVQEMRKRQEEAEELEKKLKVIQETVPTRIFNVCGSSAGAGSGDFHQYRMIRRREQARLKRIEEDALEAEEEERKQRKYALLREIDERRTQKKRQKRQKEKQKKKAKRGTTTTTTESC